MISLTWGIPLILVIFLWDVNEFLKGRLKHLAAGVLASLIFGLCIVACFVSGWIVGVAALVGSFVLVALLRHPAFLIARKLVRFPDLGADDYRTRETREFQKVVRHSGSPRDFFEWAEKRKQAGEVHMGKTVDMAMGRSDVQKVLKKNSCSKQDVEAFYERLYLLPPQSREKATCNADMLQYFLQNSVRSQLDGKYVRNITEANVAMTLDLWAEHNPTGAAPREQKYPW